MEWLSYAVDLNGQGVALVNNSANNGDLALEYFKGSLEVLSWIAISYNDYAKQEELAKYHPIRDTSALYSFFQKRKTDKQGHEQVPSNHQSNDSKHDDDNVISNTRSLPTNNNNNNGDEIDSNHFVFEKPLSFSAVSTILQNPGQISFCIAVVEFNMGLALHLQGRRCGWDKYLSNALHVYDCCLEHIARSGCSMESSQLLVFAALNNKAALLYELCNFQVARNVLKALSDGIQRCKKTGFLNAIDDSDLEGFLFNVMLLKGVCVAPAA